MAKCKSCGASIRWERQKSGKMMPVNLPGQENHEAGISHFATCPQAGRHRK